ncbi:MAG TPA: chemotaxis protein CheB [Actinospica sp.]|nr:chemotaxis protein CheB [Actinospica sp.]
MDGGESVDGPYRVLVLAASAGGIGALRALLAGLPEDLPIPVLVVQHLAPHYQTSVAQVIGRGSRLDVRLAEDGERIGPGTVYVAPPDHHMLVSRDGTVRLTETELVNYVRPAADPLFISAAAVHGSGTIACVLTGAGRDGAAGAAAVKAAGGAVLVQDPATAWCRSMPDAALARCEVDAVLPLESIAPAIARLTVG